MLIDNGWYSALRRPNVDLNVSKIERVVPDGVLTEEGLVRADVLVFASGFRTDAFMEPIQIIGTGGADISRRLRQQPEAYLGMSMASCPNLMITPGPNGVPGHAGNNAYYAECQVAYIVALLGTMRARGATRVEVRKEAVADFIGLVDRNAGDLLWSLPSVHNWYLGSHKRVTAILPMPILEFWRMNRTVDADAYTYS